NGIRGRAETLPHLTRTRPFGLARYRFFQSGPEGRCDDPLACRSPRERRHITRFGESLEPSVRSMASRVCDPWMSVRAERSGLRPRSRSALPLSLDFGAVRPRSEPAPDSIRGRTMIQTDALTQVI